MDTIQTSSLPSILFLAGIAVIGLIVVGLIFAKLYKRATKETAFVRTGLGGEKVIKDGGAIVLPVVHEVIPVNMNTLRIEVEKIQKDALITKDRMRVDVKADFYLRVAPNANGISMAAQTLGTRTTRAEEVKKLMESKFVDVLRAVAAEMTMTEMHEQRADFVQKVQQSLSNHGQLFKCARLILKQGGQDLVPHALGARMFQILWVAQHHIRAVPKCGHIGMRSGLWHRKKHQLCRPKRHHCVKNPLKSCRRAQCKPVVNHWR